MAVSDSLWVRSDLSTEPPLLALGVGGVQWALES